MASSIGAALSAQLTVRPVLLRVTRPASLRTSATSSKPPVKDAHDPAPLTLAKQASCSVSVPGFAAVVPVLRVPEFPAVRSTELAAAGFHGQP